MSRADEPSGDALAEIEVQRTSDGYVVSAFSRVNFRVSADGLTIVADGPGAADPGAGDLLEHYVRPLTYQLFGRPSLHASAVAFGPRAVGFLGRSGLGKSTLAAMLAERGAHFVGDDALTIAEGPGHRVVVGAPRARLRATSMEALLDVSGATKSFGDRTEVPFPPIGRPPCLAALFILGPASHEIAITPLSRRDAIAEIAVHLHRIDPTDPALLEKEFAFLEDLASNVLVARLDYPRDFAAIDAVRAAILSAVLP